METSRGERKEVGQRKALEKTVGGGKSRLSALVRERQVQP